MNPNNLPSGLSSAEIRNLKAEHELQRPDHLKCTHPSVPRALQVMWSDWCTKKRRLESLLAHALHDEENQWKDADGNVVQPAPWKPEPTAYVAEQRRQAEERREHLERKTAARKNPGGRPRSENPSPKALKRREGRARKRALREAGLVA